MSSSWPCGRMRLRRGGEKTEPGNLTLGPTCDYLLCFTITAPVFVSRTASFFEGVASVVPAAQPETMRPACLTSDSLEDPSRPGHHP